ncbi:S-layer homology domain-containing protein [Sporosarcina sp. CAU 1771]
MSKRKKISVKLCLVVLLVLGATLQTMGIKSTSAASSILFVKQDAAGDGSSWNNAFGTVQDALDTATAGDEIWIASGTYYPTKDASDFEVTDRTRTFKMKNNVAIYGGFPATGNPTWNDRNWELYETILSGDHNKDDDPNDVTKNRSDNSYSVFHLWGSLKLDETAILDGVTITGGTANGSTHYNYDKGGGIYIGGDLHNSGGIQNNPFLNNINIIGNSAGQGGGLYIGKDSTPTLENIAVTNNKSISGGGIFNRQGTLLMKNFSISGNSAESNGGGMHNLGGLLKISNGTIQNNHSTVNSGGAIHSTSSGTMELTDVDILDNTARGYGGGIGIDTSDLTITGGKLENNQSGTAQNFSSGGAIHIIGGHLALNDVDIIGNKASGNGGGVHVDFTNAPINSFKMNGGEIKGNRAASVNFGNILGGGGIYYSHNRNESMEMTNVTIEGNSVNPYRAGGGIYLHSSNATFTNVDFLSNRSGNGGGLYVKESSPIFTNVQIRGNEAIAEENSGYGPGNGGGIYLYNKGKPIFRNVLITGNIAHGPEPNSTAFGFGGGIYDVRTDGSIAELINVTIANNSARTSGGGYYFGYSNASGNFKNSIVWGNSTMDFASYKNNVSTTEPWSTGVPTYTGIMNFSHSLIGGLVNLGDTNYNTDAKFVSPVAMGYGIASAEGDYRLQEGSPAIDTGNNDYVPAGISKDLQGLERIVNGTVDLGAYEDQIPIIDKLITKIDTDFDNKAVQLGSELEELELPTKVTVTLNDLSKVELGIVWDEGSPAYNKEVAGDYSFTGTLTLPTGVTNPDGLFTSVLITVSPPKTILLDSIIEVAAKEVLQILGTKTTLLLPDNLPVGTTLKVLRADEPLPDGLETAGDIFNFMFTFPAGSNDYNGSFILSLGAEDNIDAANTGIYYYNETTNKWEYVGGKGMLKDGVITITVDHFSIYGVLAESIVTDPIPPDPDPGDGGSSGGSGYIPSDNAYLKDLALLAEGKPFVFKPAFSTNAFDYTVETNKNEVMIKFEPSDPRAKVYFQEREIRDGLKINLEEGDNVLTFIVEAESGLKKTYKVTVHHKVESPTDSNKPVILTDITGHWAQSYIQQGVTKGLIKGHIDGTFKPNAYLTRAQAASLIVRALGVESEKLAPFDDITGYANETQREISAAYAFGIIKGFSDGNFKPGDPVTRAQFALMLYRAYEQKTGLKYVAVAKVPYPDVGSYDEETVNSITMLHELGIANGSNGYYMPTNATTRAQAAKMLVNFFNKLN